MFVQLLFLSLALMCSCLPTGQENDCAAILKGGGASLRFPGLVAHGIHSMNIRQLRKFKPDITEKNSVPTINMDLSDNNPILSNAPDVPIAGRSFKTEGMITVDQVLSHMDDSKYDIKMYSSLERLVHALHMHEVWSEAKAQYEKLTKNPPSDDFCQCARDVENNGIMKMMRVLALEIREPALMYGKHKKLENGSVIWDDNNYNYGGNIYNYAFVRKENTPLLRKPEEVVPRLKNEAAWAFWKNLMINMPASDHYELALYLYCTLNDATKN